MSPAKATHPKVEPFFVKSGEQIHNLPQFGNLPDLDKKYLADKTIYGVRRGFTFDSCFQQPIVVTIDSDDTGKSLPGIGAHWVRENGRSVLILPGGTKFEPKTTQEMEDEINALQKSSRKEI